MSGIRPDDDDNDDDGDVDDDGDDDGDGDVDGDLPLHGRVQRPICFCPCVVG